MSMLFLMASSVDILMAASIGKISDLTFVVFSWGVLLVLVDILGLVDTEIESGALSFAVLNALRFVGVLV